MKIDKYDRERKFIKNLNSIGNENMSDDEASCASPKKKRKD